MNVTSREQVIDMVEAAIDTFGSVQFQFNSARAAIGGRNSSISTTNSWRRTFALNVKGALYGIQAVLPHMLRTEPGVIVNMASMAPRRGGPGTSVHYAAAKGAVGR